MKMLEPPTKKVANRTSNDFMQNHNKDERDKIKGNKLKKNLSSFFFKQPSNLLDKSNKKK